MPNHPATVSYTHLDVYKRQFIILRGWPPRISELHSQKISRRILKMGPLRKWKDTTRQYSRTWEKLALQRIVLQIFKDFCYNAKGYLISNNRWLKQRYLNISHFRNKSHPRRRIPIPTSRTGYLVTFNFTFIVCWRVGEFLCAMLTEMNFNALTRRRNACLLYTSRCV